MTQRTGRFNGIKLCVRDDEQFAVNYNTRFFRSWLAAPIRVAAISPSGQSLARIITSEICASDGPVLELGPGTGVFTKALLDRGLKQEDLTLIEIGSEFATILREQFPACRILQEDAAKLKSLDLFPDQKAGAIVSGLGLLSMSPRKVIAILSGAISCLHPFGSFYQFTYGPRCPVSRPILDRLGLKAQRVGSTLCNIPPASVYRISRRGPQVPGMQRWPEIIAVASDIP